MQESDKGSKRGERYKVQNGEVRHRRTDQLGQRPCGAAEDQGGLWRKHLIRTFEQHAYDENGKPQKVEVGGRPTTVEMSLRPTC